MISYAYRMKLELRHLRSFVVLAEELHFGRAARRLAITQPAVSHQLAQAEELLGVELLRRSPRSVSLTPAGRTLLTGARRVLGELERTLRDLGQHQSALRNRLVLGYVEYAYLPVVSGLVRTLRERYPDLELEHREMYAAQQVEALRDGEIDVGFALLPASDLKLVARPILEGFWGVALPRRHPLARLPNVPLAALAGEPLIVFARALNPPLYDWLLTRLRESGFEPRLAYQTSQAHFGPRLVQEGVGLFIAASYVLTELPRGVVVRPLEGLGDKLVLGALWRPDNRAPALRALQGALPPRR